MCVCIYIIIYINTYLKDIEGGRRHGARDAFEGLVPIHEACETCHARARVRAALLQLSIVQQIDIVRIGRLHSWRINHVLAAKSKRMQVDKAGEDEKKKMVTLRR